MAQPANTMALTGYFLDANGNSPYEGSIVTSAPAAGFFEKNLAGSPYFQAISINGPFPSGAISGGVYTLYLPWPSQTNFGGQSLTWEVFFPDGTVWAGVVLEGVATAQLPDLATPTNGWSRVQVGSSPPVLQGTQGIQGIQGVIGQTGPQGAPFNWRGQWSSTSAFAVGDAVQDGGSAWECYATVAAGGTNPGNDSAHWTLVAAKGATGATGSTGSTGPQGPTGAPGAAGSGTTVPTLQVTYGARGDGVTDDYQAIGNYLADLAAGRPTVAIPRANYYISKPFAVPMSTDRPGALATTIKLTGVGNGGSTNGHYPIGPSGRGSVFDFHCDGNYNPYLNDYAIVAGGDLTVTPGAAGAVTLSLSPVKAFINNTTVTDVVTATQIGTNGTSGSALTIPVIPNGWYWLDISRDGHVYLGYLGTSGDQNTYWVKSVGGAGTSGSPRQLSGGAATGAAYCTTQGTRPDTIRLYEIFMQNSAPSITRDARCYLGCFNHRGNGTLLFQDICLARLDGVANAMPFIVANGTLKTQDVQFWGGISANFKGNPGIPSQDAIHIGGSGSWYYPGGSDSYSNYSIMAGYGSRLRNDLAQNIRKYFWIRGNGQDVVVENPYLMGNCGNNKDGTISGIELSGSLASPATGIHIVNPEFEMSSYAHAIRIGGALITQVISPVVSDANNGWLAANIAAHVSTISVASATLSYPTDITNWLGQEVLLDANLATEEVVPLATTPATAGGAALPAVTGTAGQLQITFATSTTRAVGDYVLVGTGQAVQEVVQLGSGGTGTVFTLSYPLGYSYSAAPAGLGPWVLTFGATNNAYAHAVTAQGPTVSRTIGTVKYVTGENGNSNLLVGGSTLGGTMRLVTDPTPAGTNGMLSGTAVNTRAVTVSAKAALGAAGPVPVIVNDSAGTTVMTLGQRTLNGNIAASIDVPYGQGLALQANAGSIFLGTDGGTTLYAQTRAGSGFRSSAGDTNPSFFFQNFSPTFVSDHTQWLSSTGTVLARVRYDGLITAAGVVLTPAATTGKPLTGTYVVGQMYMDSAGTLYICTVAGTPGTFKTVTAT